MMVKVVGAMKRRGIRNLLRHAALVAVTFIMVYPILWMFFSSFKPDDQIFSTSRLWPETWTLDHYLAGFNGELGMNFGQLMWNSLIISVVVVVGTIFSSTLTGFAFCAAPVYAAALFDRVYAVHHDAAGPGRHDSAIHHVS